MDPSVGLGTALAPGLWFAGLATALHLALARWFDPVPRRVIAVHTLTVLILLGSSLFLGYIQLPLQVLRGTQPLTFIDPAEHPGIVLQADLVEDFFPYIVEVKRAFSEGQWPLLSPLVSGGEPLLANTQAQGFHPLTLSTLPLPLERAFAVIAASKLFCALTFAFLWLRRTGLGPPASLAGSAVFGLGGFMMSWLGWPHTHSAVGLMIILYALEGSFAEGRRRWELLLCIGTLWVLLGGHPQTTVLAAIAAGIWTVGLALRRRARESSFRAAWIPTGHAVAAALCAALLAAPILLPAALWLPDTSRYHLTQAVQQQAPGPGAQVRAVSSDPDVASRLHSRLRTRTGMLAGPLAFGSPELRRYWGYQNLIEDGAMWSGTVALLALFTSALAGVRRRGPHRPWRGERPAILLVAIGYVTSLELPGLHELLTTVPILGSSLSNPSRFALFIAVGASFLVALLLQRLLDSADLPASSRRHYVITVGLAGAAALAFVAWATLGNPPPEGPTSEQLLSLRTKLLWCHIGVVLAVLWALRRPDRRAVWAVAILVCFELLVVNHRLHRPMPTRMFFPDSEALTFLQENLRSEGGAGLAAPRMVGTGNLLLPNLATVYGIPDARSSNPLRSDLMARLDAPLRDGEFLYVLADHPLYDLFGIRYILRRRWASKPELPVALRERVAVFERPGTMPVAWLPETLVPSAGDPVGRTQRVEDFGHSAVVGDDLGLPARNRRPGDRVTVIAEDRDGVVLHANVAEPALIATRISYERGSWRALIDDHAAPVVQTNAAMVGVVVPEGSSKIELIYRPRGLLFGSLLAGIGLTLVIGRLILPADRPGIDLRS